MSEHIDKLAPCSPDAEMAVLGSILTDSACLFEVNTFLKPSDYFIVKNAWVMDAINALSEDRQQIDKLTVIEKLRTTPNGNGGFRLESIGGSAYLTELTNAVTDHHHIETYARIVERAAIRRRLLSAASEIAQVSLEENSPIDQVIDHAESILFGVTERHNPDVVESAGQIVSRYYDHVEQLYSKKIETLGITTGFNHLDHLLSGLQKGELYIIGAPPGVGKTAFALHLAMNGAKQGHPALFMSLEMTTEQLINRLVGSSMNLNTMDLQTGNLNEDQWKRFTDGLSDVKKWPLFIDAPNDLSVMKLRTIARRLRHEAKIEALYVDYLQLMNDPGRDNREQEISAISRGLKLLSKELNLPVVVCAQLNRDVEKRADHKPQLSDLRESGAIEQNADVVMFLYRDDLYNENTERPNQCDIILAKHRNGPTGLDTLYFKKEYVQFTSMDKNKLDLRDGFGERTPQKWTVPQKTPPVHIGDNYHETDRRNGDEGK